MSDSAHKSLLARLAGRQKDEIGEDPWTTLAAKRPEHEQEEDPQLDNLLARVNQLVEQQGSEQPSDEPRAGFVGRRQPASAPAAARPAPQPETPSGPSSGGLSAPAIAEAASPSGNEAALPQDQFVPQEPRSLREANLTESELEALILKYLFARGDATGRQIAGQVCLPFVIVNELLRQMKNDKTVVYKSAAEMNDYLYCLTDFGGERARRYSAQCTYFGAAPVSLDEYIAGVEAQSLNHLKPRKADLERAFQDLLISPRMLARLGPAINSGRGMFLFGAPGNGKTSIAERVTGCFGKHIWIPRSLGIDGDIIRVYDPNAHVAAPLAPGEGLLDQSKIDKRWVRIRRPTIVVGGELRMDALEIRLNRTTNISEAPLQIKSNCGTLVIDDFGRQRMSTDELLNRWIVPLEKRYDFLNLPSGKKIEVPFDQLIVFSTNLEPRELVDEAFLRRIPYKIEVVDPEEHEFRELFQLMCPKLGFEYHEGAVEHLIHTHYQQAGRSFRCCHPRDLLMQVRNHCLYENKELKLSPEYFDFAVENYFAVM